MKTLLKTRKNEIGATAIEYGLIASLISVGIIASVTAVGGHLNTVFTTVSSALGSNSSAG
jgi:pilus assembly protein Flp/PilA